MQNLRLWIRNVFGFSRSETNGFLILLPGMLIILFSYPIFNTFFNQPITNVSDEQTKIDSLIAHWDFNPQHDEKAGPKALFLFDPNKSTIAEFDSLGLPPNLARRIINYRDKGGRFRKPEDLLTIYGMDSSLYTSLAPFISIPDIKEKKALSPNTKFNNEKRSKSFLPQDLNLADTLQLKLVNGIGTVLANRIVKYRNALGGFVDYDQMNEVYGLDSTVVNLIKKRFFINPDFTPIQLDLNTVSERELSSHPYIRSKIAKTIIAYRFQHGSFKEIDDLLKIDLIDQQVFNRIMPYLKIEP